MKKNHIDHIDEQVENEAPIVFVLKYNKNKRMKFYLKINSLSHLLLRPVGFDMRFMALVLLFEIDLSDFASQSLK
jgi:hypothetical protein